jgi:hypothetical protein
MGLFHKIIVKYSHLHTFKRGDMHGKKGFSRTSQSNTWPKKHLNHLLARYSTCPVQPQMTTLKKEKANYGTVYCTELVTGPYHTHRIHSLELGDLFAFPPLAFSFEPRLRKKIRDLSAVARKLDRSTSPTSLQSFFTLLLFRGIGAVTS